MIEPETREIPTVYEAVLDATKIASWLRDIETSARDLEVRVRGAAGYSTGKADTNDLRRWLDRILESGDGALQLRYRFQSRNWCDTILPHEEGCRLVRLEVPAHEETDGRAEKDR